MRTKTAAIALAATLTLAGCKPDAAVRRGEVLEKNTTPASMPTVTSPAVDTSQFGTVSGVVHFSGKPPARIPIDMSMDPACALRGGTNLSEQYVVSNGRLANVFVYIKSGAPRSNAPAGSAPAVIDQKGCRFVPHVVAVQQGGAVQFTTSDPTMHNVHITPQAAGNQGSDMSQGPMGAPQTRTFGAAELMIPVRCNNHPWMNAFINVAPNPYFAVTGEDGSFSIHLPPGSYTLAAVHEKLGEVDIPITIAAHATAQGDFTFPPAK